MSARGRWEWVTVFDDLCTVVGWGMALSVGIALGIMFPGMPDIKDHDLARMLTGALVAATTGVVSLAVLRFAEWLDRMAVKIA